MLCSWCLFVTTGAVNFEVWALSRYDAKSLYNKKPTVTEIKSGGRMDFLDILEANDGSIWFGSGGGVYRYDGKTIMDFRRKEDQKYAPFFSGCGPVTGENKNNATASSLSLHVGNEKYIRIDTKESVVAWKGSSVKRKQEGYAYISKGEFDD